MDQRVPPTAPPSHGTGVPSGDTTSGGKQHYQLLDGLRGVAAACVALFHASFVFGGSTLFPHAELAVDFFFILSGFVVSYAYSARLLDSRISIIGFLRARAIRLYPLIMLGALLGFVTQIDVEGSIIASAQAFALGTLALPDFANPERLFLTNPPSWSLFFELIASSAFAVTIFWQRRWTLLTFVMANFAIFSALAFEAGVHNLGYSRDGFAAGFPRVFSTFFGGVLLQRLQATGQLRLKAPVWIISAAVAASFLYPLTPHDVIARLALMAILYPLCIVAGANTSPPDGWLNGLTRIAGDISFPLYVLHWPIYRGVTICLQMLHVSKSAHVHWYGLFAFILAFPFSWLALKLYDEPIRKRLSRN